MLDVQAAGLEADVFVADSEVRYLAPLFADLRAQARIAEGESWERFVATLRERGRARTTLVATVPLHEFGRASGRARVCQYVEYSVDAVQLKKKLQKQTNRSHISK